MDTKYIIHILVCVFGMGFSSQVKAQSVWPSVNWSNAINLTSVMNGASNVLELSGLHWNPELNRLYAISDEGVLYVLQQSVTKDSFSQLAKVTGLDGPEGITQVNLSANEFYTIDEKTYQIRKYTHTSDFSKVTLSNYWNVLDSPSPMSNTDNTGPEGIAFVPDSYLVSKGFISSATGGVYKSVKGMGGLIFLAHQKKGLVWVFDLNPNVSNDFAYVGKYKTSEDESCDLSFDRSTGLLYILHNTGDNYLEVTDLTTTPTSGDRKFVPLKEYFIPNPDGNTNVEGFAVTPKYADSTRVSAWLCRDVESSESSSDIKDCLRWFSAFSAEGSAIKSTGVNLALNTTAGITPNPVRDYLKIEVPDMNSSTALRIYDLTGQLRCKEILENPESVLNVSDLSGGIYIIELQTGNRTFRSKIIKQ
jgi:hypothetical protein